MKKEEIEKLEVGDDIIFTQSEYDNQSNQEKEYEVKGKIISFDHIEEVGKGDWIRVRPEGSDPGDPGIHIDHHYIVGKEED